MPLKLNLPSRPHCRRLHSAAALALTCAALTIGYAPRSVAKPPPGFTALYNGENLNGWRGGDTFDHRKFLALPADTRQAQDAAWTKDMQAHWKAEGEELVNDGQGKYATTIKDYGDIELLVDYRTVPKADSGIYLRGVPQVQIWDFTDEAKFKLGADKGSGGLWNNPPGSPGKNPLVLADKPFGEWNHFRIVQLGARTWVWLNDKPVVENALMANYYDAKTPIPPKGPIELQTHGGEIRWRNVFVREVPSAEANSKLRGQDPAGFQSVFNGQDFDGWAGPVDNYEVKDGALVCKPGKGGTIFTKADYTNFVARLEFKLPRGGNNGLAIRYPGTGDTAYAGMCELQVLDDAYEQATGQKIDARQAHGSAYGMAAAARGYQRPIGEWNYQEVTVNGSRIKVELNGTVILDTDLSTASDYMANSPHPGKTRTSGHFGFAGHNDPVMFRNVSIKNLP
jgi:hypothetical protein